MGPDQPEPWELITDAMGADPQHPDWEAWFEYQRTWTPRRPLPTNLTEEAAAVLDFLAEWHDSGKASGVTTLKRLVDEWAEDDFAVTE